MAEYRALASGQVLPASFLNALQQFISTTTSTFHLTLANASTIQIFAGVNSAQTAVGIDGLWRYNSGTITQAITGGAGTYDVFVTCGPNAFSNTPSPDTDTTVYAFALSVVAHGSTPTTNGTTLTNYRKIGEVDWTGSAINGLRQTEGNFDSRYPMTPTSPEPAINALRALAATGQTAALQTWENPPGTTVASVSPQGGATFDAVVNLIAGALAPTQALTDSSGNIATTQFMQEFITQAVIRAVGSSTVLAAEFIQPGDLIHSAAATRAGALFCDGSIFTKAGYPNLFTAIGTTYGPGNNDGVSGNLPDFTGLTVVGAGNTNASSPLHSFTRTAFARGSTGGVNAYALQASEGSTNGNGYTGYETAQHSHSVPGTAANGQGAFYFNPPPGWGGVIAYAGGYQSGYSTISIAGAPGSSLNIGAETAEHQHVLTGRAADAAHQNMQPYGTANIFIKT